MPIATWSRVLQFRSGPNEYRFHACEEHKVWLDNGDAGSGNFFARSSDPVEPVDPDDEIECDMCREG